MSEPMKIIVADDYADLSRKAADAVARQIQSKPSSLLVLPTGNTPLGLFRDLIGLARLGLDVSAIRFAVLDDYAGIKSDDRRSLTAWLGRELLLPLGIGAHRLLAFETLGDAALEGPRMDAAIKAAGGIDLAVLGLGPNGHLGMNEPGTPFDQPSFHAVLTPATIRSNAVYWGSEADVPRAGFTLGLGTLGAAQSLLLLVSGAHKAEILAHVIKDRDSELPAALVHRHPRATIIADQAAYGSNPSN